MKACTRSSRWLARMAGSLILSALAALAAAGEADWQASAKGLTDGPLCSLVLRVEAGDALSLAVSGGTTDAGWGTLGPCPIPLGSIAPHSPLKLGDIERSGDWSGARFQASFDGGERLTLTASQLSPGLLIEAAGKRVKLFGGSQPHMFTRDGAKLKIHSTRHRANAPVLGTITPPFLAMPQGQGGVKVFATAEAMGAPPAAEAWALAWWGAASHFLRTDRPNGGHGHHPDAYVADCPLLLVFDAPPTSILTANDGGLEFSFAQAGRRMAVLPVYGAAHPRAEATQKWAAAFPDALVKHCRKLAAFARKYPVSARQSFRYDAAKDTATFTERIAFVDVGSGGVPLAPLPPMAAVAMKGGLPVAVERALTDLGVPTEFGPLLGVENAESVAWMVAGLGRYAAPPAKAGEGGKAPAALEAELRAQVDKVLAAGRLLAPWAYADNVPINASRGEYYWGEPGEELGILAGIAPALDGERLGTLKEYMGALRQAYPPETRAIIPPDAGARRGGYDLGPCQLTKRVLAERGSRVSLFALYGLARCVEAAGGKPDAKAWQACRGVLADAFTEQAWGTLYLLGHPNRTLPWMKRKGAADGPSPHWRGDRPAAVVNVNRQFAGAIGTVRLARRMGDAEAEQQAWRLLARAAVLRGAMGKLPAWRYAAGIVAIPEDPAWFWKWKQRGPQTWKGDLETDRWASPADDVRQVVDLAPDRVELANWAGVVGNAWTQRCTAQLVAFRCITPELAAFLRDHLRAESAALVARIEWNQPTWYASFAEAILGWEHNMNHPSDAYQVFLARAWILGERPERLERWLDVPWLERGDLFYIHKLAETLRAYGRGNGAAQ